MGGLQTKDKCIANEKAIERLKTKVRSLQGEINEIMCIREGENQAYEREMVVFAIKEMEWKKEKKKLKEDMKKLGKRLELKGVENLVVDEKCKKEEGYLWEEQEARRDEAVEKWKQLYFAIKVELDDLILRTYQGEGLCWKAEEDAMLDELHKDLVAKEEQVQILEAQIANMKKEEYKREREIDILRQSLRIMCFNKKQQIMQKNLPESCSCREKMKI